MALSPDAGLLNHLVELRTRLMKILFVVSVLFVGLFIFAKPLFHLLAVPLTNALPEGTVFIATEVTSPVTVLFTFSFVLALMLSAPYWLHQCWGFIAPGLYCRERRLTANLLLLTVGLFYLGVLFAYFLVLPLLFYVFSQFVPQSVWYMPDIRHYLTFCLRLFLLFGLVFQTPVLVVLLLETGAVTVATLKQSRPYVVVAIFILAMLLTPPDVVSQLLLALPLWCLFELGLLIGRFSQ